LFTLYAGTAEISIPLTVAEDPGERYVALPTGIFPLQLAEATTSVPGPATLRRSSGLRWSKCSWLMVTTSPTGYLGCGSLYGSV
jgi:hypothetical protein